jgi:photosystem II stability/assembly factor-like uncharacterized protein
MSDDPVLSKRARRAVALLASALTAIVLAAVLYIQAVAPPTPSGAVTPTSIPVMSGPYSATYDFLTPSLGWALVVDYSTFSTNYWIFKTTDGARHWQAQHAGQAEGGQTYLHFFDDQHGFAYVGMSYRSVDGGTHWQTVEVPGSIPYVTFASPTLGWAEAFQVGTQRLYKTTDGGATWTLLPTDLPGAAVLEPIFEIQSSTFRASGEGWLGAGYLASPVVYLTLDAGASWQTIQVPTPRSAAAGRGYLTSVRLVPGGGVVVLVSDDSKRVLDAFFSSDRGNSWREVTFPVALTTSDDLSFVNATTWWSLASGQIYKTTDAGTTWTRLAVSGLPDGWRFESAQAIDTNHAWWAMVSSARSTTSGLAMTSDGGKHWTMVNPPQPQ